MTITLTDEEATLLCALIEDEKNCCGYEQYWTVEQRETFDEIVYKLNVALELKGNNNFA